jgi:hypothetical protein
MDRSHARVSPVVPALVCLIVVGVALALWFYLRGPAAEPKPRPSPALDHDAAIERDTLSVEARGRVARSGG